MGKSAHITNALIAGAISQVGFTDALQEVDKYSYMCADCAGSPSELSPEDREIMRLMCAKRQYLSASKNVQELISEINPSVFDMFNIDAVQEFDRKLDQQRMKVVSKDFMKEMDQKRLTMLYNSISQAHLKIGRLETTMKRMVERDMRITAENATLRNNVTYWRNQADQRTVAKNNLSCQVADLMVEQEKLQQELKKEKQANELRKGTGIVPKRLVRYQRMTTRPVSWGTQNN